MGGLSLGELKGAIASRPSKNTDDDDDGARPTPIGRSALSGASVVVDARRAKRRRR